MDKLLTFTDRQAFREWLGKYGTESDDIWLLFSKKGKSVILSVGDAQIQMFSEIIQPHEPAYTNLLAMSHSVQRIYTGFYLDAKSDKTRQARLEKIIDRLNRNLKPM